MNKCRGVRAMALQRLYCRIYEAMFLVCSKNILLDLHWVSMVYASFSAGLKTCDNTPLPVAFFDYKKSFISSKGLRIFNMSLLVTCRYLSVVLRSLCPNSFCIKTTSVPLSSRWVAKLCRSICILPVLWIPALSFAAFMIDSRLLVL